MEKILIADDDINLCNALTESLREFGYDVSYVNDGQKAIDYLKANQVNILLLDLKMPIKNGFEVLLELNKKENRTKVIMMTAYVDSIKALELPGIGPINLINKPFEFDSLLRAIRCKLHDDDKEIS